MPLDVTMLFTITRPVVAFCALLGGTLLFFMGPRLVHTIAQTNTASWISRSLLARWTHLFLLELIADTFIASGLVVINILVTFPLSILITLILFFAFASACLLSIYI